MKFIERTKGVADDGEQYHVLIDESGDALVMFPSIQDNQRFRKLVRSIEKRLSKQFGKEVYLPDFLPVPLPKVHNKK